MSLSIIIPTLNEAAVLGQTLAAIGTPHRCQENKIEVIVVDGGSQDETWAIAQTWGATVLQSPPGRAQQMNLGATIAQSEVLLFLHADTLLPDQYWEAIKTTIAQPRVIAGAFDLCIDAPGKALRWVEWGVKGRSHLLQLPYGDQGIFVPRDIFRAMGGYANLPIMEDYQFIQDLKARFKHQGNIAIVNIPVKTHPRRWQKLGILRTTMINQAIILGYHLSIPPAKLRQWYRWYNGANPCHKSSDTSPP